MAAPSMSKHIGDALKRIDRNLCLTWNEEFKVWDVVRMMSVEPGKSVWVCSVENPDGSYRHPDQRLIDYLISCDLGRFKGDNHEQRMVRYIAEKNEKNAVLRAKRKREGVDERYDRFVESREAASSLGVTHCDGDSVQRIRRHLRKDSQRMKEYDDYLTRDEKSRILRGADPITP